MTTDHNAPTDTESSAVVDVTKAEPGEATEAAPGEATEAASGEATEAASGEFQEILLEVGPGGGRKQRFQGQLLGQARSYTTDGVELTQVYLSRKGKYVVHRRISEWSDFAAMSWITDWRKNWRDIFDINEQVWADYTVEVVESFADLAGRIPAKIYRSLVDMTQYPQAEDLDI
ncbi:EXLDI protein [Nocardia sp. NPDC005998]|uniref:EXLDI protein n=1 Tax=Nocardia sp. NPDC005998 TaxID=3156894 RepID=UPI0033B25669